MSTQRRKRVLKKIIFVGDPDVGKTSFLYMYLEKKFQNRRSTIGADFATKEVLINDTPVTLQIWDTAGREKWAHPGIAFFRGADGVIMFYDTTNKRSFENIAKWREDILKHAQNASVILVGTKTDLENKRQVRMEDAEELAQAWNIPCIEVSSKEDLGVQEAVRLLLDQMQLYEFFVSLLNSTEMRKKKNLFTIILLLLLLCGNPLVRGCIRGFNPLLLWKTNHPFPKKGNQQALQTRTQNLFQEIKYHSL
mmetsp:Transcript_17959/g.25060  ORF Transcript_17959/g.25060 Transcript_17959/m.25060 type:complete len:251 (-) Transcript_17959:2602-3354(-)